MSEASANPKTDYTELERLKAEATPGPWVYADCDGNWFVWAAPGSIAIADCDAEAFAALIVALRNAAPDLIVRNARRLGRSAVLIELNEDYCAMAARRLQQLSLLAEPA